jgi:hypothetical protein
VEKIQIESLERLWSSNEYRYTKNLCCNSYCRNYQYKYYQCVSSTWSPCTKAVRNSYEITASLLRTCQGFAAPSLSLAATSSSQQAREFTAVLCTRSEHSCVFFYFVINLSM